MAVKEGLEEGEELQGTEDTRLRAAGGNVKRRGHCKIKYGDTKFPQKKKA